ncbi:MAG TPA: FAD:protein FMN transferase [Acidimicrobiales bacterium]|jgi:thiamine biosynthesis lipoprotein|nr:FAD:protein FMN transferase [Acidimicrobiales bacterium]
MRSVPEAVRPTFSETRVIHHQEEVMGTVVTFTLYPSRATPEGELYLCLAAARSVLRRADAVFSTWRPHSPLSRLRRDEISLDACPTVVREVLDQCLTMREVTDGWFDPWAMPGGVDPTGMVKGWAAEQALREFQSVELGGAIVNAAGDISTFGGPRAFATFRVGVVDPHHVHQLACTANVVGAIATSGTYERGSHLVDPRSGRREVRCASATVTGPSLAIADALATALAVAGAEGLRFVDRLAEYQGFVVALDGSRASSGAFPFAAEAI